MDQCFEILSWFRVLSGNTMCESDWPMVTQKILVVGQVKVEGRKIHVSAWGQTKRGSVHKICATDKECWNPWYSDSRRLYDVTTRGGSVEEFQSKPSDWTNRGSNQGVRVMHGCWFIVCNFRNVILVPWYAHNISTYIFPHIYIAVMRFIVRILCNNSFNSGYFFLSVLVKF